jgi:UTP:GlnB (protein PII) uridylyltransferase
MQAERQENQMDHLHLDLLPLCKQQQEYWLIKFHTGNRLQHSRNVKLLCQLHSKIHTSDKTNKQTSKQRTNLKLFPAEGSVLGTVNNKRRTSILSVEDVDRTNCRSTVKEIIKTTSLQQLRRIPDDQRVLNIPALQQ